MQFPHEYSKISVPPENITPPVLSVPAAHNPDVALQFFDTSGHQYLAVHDVTPYGERTEEAVNAVTPDLLPIKYSGEDYRLFEVPKDMLSVSAATLGSGIRDLADLQLMYERAGKLVQANSDRYAMRGFDISKLAFLKESGQVLFVPPYKFRQGHADINYLSYTVSRTIERALIPVFTERKISHLVNAMIRGLNNESA